MTVSVRRATVADARVIAGIRVTSWHAAYAGRIPAVLLERLDVDREASARARHWDEHNTDPRTAQLLADVDGLPVGWAASGPSRDPDAAHDGELYALYALPEHWSTGVGHALITAAEDALHAAGYRRASLWVLEGNTRAETFYERHGWREDGTAKDDDRFSPSTGTPPLRERRRVRHLGGPVSR